MQGRQVGERYAGIGAEGDEIGAAVKRRRGDPFGIAAHAAIDDLDIEEMWTTYSADLGDADQATVTLQFMSNAGSELMLIDFVRFTGTCLEL